MTEEERRAAAFREQCVTAARSRAALFARLTGDPAAAAAVRASWAPLLPDPLDGWDCPDPPTPARAAWASRVPGDIELPEYLKGA
jgi:hypothetical protein